MEELVGAVGKLKNGKAGGISGIRPEILKVACQSPGFMDRLLDLVHTTWKEQSVPEDWTDAVLIPIPKKGDLFNCDNWRGISLLDVVGKVIARILQDCLQQLAEEELPESQCGFRKGKGCSDMIFGVRQVVEKSWEHRSKNSSFLSLSERPMTRLSHRRVTPTIWRHNLSPAATRNDREAVIR